MTGIFSDLKQLAPLFSKREKAKLGLLFGLMMAGALMEAVGISAIPVFVAIVTQPATLSEHAWLADRLPPLPEAPTVELVLVASGLLLGFVLFKNAFLAGVYYAQSRIVSRQRARLGDRIFRAYQSAPYDWLLRRSSAELQRNIQFDTQQIFVGVVTPFLDLTLSVFLSIAVVLAMVLATPSTTLLSMAVVGGGFFLVIRTLRRHMARVGEVTRDENERAIKAIQQGFGALVDARIIGCEEHLANVHRRSLFRLSRAMTVRGTLTKATPNAIETLAVLGMLLIILLIVLSGESIAASLPTLSVIAVGIMRLKQTATKCATAINQINASRPSIPGIIRDLDDLAALERRPAVEEAMSSEKIGRFRELTLDGVTYSYPESATPAIDALSLELARGESIAFVGPTGCGKSTLANIVLGLLEPQSGAVRVNGMDIREDSVGWRACLGYIPQSVFLVDDTLRANIAFGVPENRIDAQRLQSALESAALDDFVGTLPEGLETVVGERGVRLSGGQRQRLGIARALYFNPQVLVMDEATSALDNETEGQVMQAIQNLKKERTLIMIAHRLSTVEDCDRLYFLSDGRIQAAGTYPELVAQSPAFRKMANMEV